MLIRGVSSFERVKCVFSVNLGPCSCVLFQVSFIVPLYLVWLLQFGEWARDDSQGNPSLPGDRDGAESSLLPRAGPFRDDCRMVVKVGIGTVCVCVCVCV